MCFLRRRLDAFRAGIGTAAAKGLVAVVALAAGLVAAEGCTIRTVATLPFARAGGHITTTARINGSAVELLIDTGAAATALDRSTAARLALPRDATRRSAIVGVGGTERATDGLSAASFEIGGLTLTAVPLIKGDFGRKRSPPVAGILGADILGRYDVEIDFGRGRLLLHEVAACAGRFLDWPGLSVVPLTGAFGGLLKLAPVAVDGKPLMALIDTGATQTVLFRRGARRLGASARPAAGDRRGFGIGPAADKPVAMFVHTFGTLAVGSQVEPKLAIAVAAADALGLDMVLGLDVLARSRVWISYATGQMFLAGM